MEMDIINKQVKYLHLDYFYGSSSYNNTILAKSDFNAINTIFQFETKKFSLLFLQP